MALRTCPDCHHEVSRHARACPYCGLPQPAPGGFGIASVAADLIAYSLFFLLPGPGFAFLAAATGTVLALWGLIRPGPAPAFGLPLLGLLLSLPFWVVPLLVVFG